MDKSALRNLPSVDALLKTSAALTLRFEYGRELLVSALQAALDAVRAAYLESGGELPDNAGIVEQAARLLEEWTAPTLHPVINATGVILHTNLGRAPLSRQAVEAMHMVAAQYNTLEFNLHSGKRGTRLLHAEKYLAQLTGAEAALVVNNNASSLLLILSALVKRRRVLISRTQLIEIGGGFRIPEVMAQSGAILVEVGATNRVHLSDYQKALDEQPIKLVMRAHQSNFRQTGFTSEPSPAELAALAHEHGLPLVDDLGSGTLLDTMQYKLQHEPTVQESLQAGADLVCFSGDKLLGGPQAGIVVGKTNLIAKLKKHPLARAIRADKTCLAALSATLLSYLRGTAEQDIPVWKMISMDLQWIKDRVEDWRNILGRGEVIEARSTIGGGSMPGETLPTHVLALDVKHPNRLMKKLREQRMPIIARLEDDRVLLDPRTVFPEQDPILLQGLKLAMK